MLASQRNRLISRGLDVLEGFDPVSIVFAGKPAILASRRDAVQSSTLGMGGFRESGEVMFLVQKSRIPMDVLIEPQLQFKVGEVSYRVEVVYPETNEPHVRFTANRAGR